VFDAANRTGGRIHSTREAFSDGLVAELGAELIDAEHVTMHTLADEFGLSMDDLFENEPAGQIRASYSFGGRFLTDAEVVDALRPVAGKLVGSVLTAGCTPRTRTTTWSGRSSRTGSPPRFSGWPR
jgi:hypothetical protein